MKEGENLKNIHIEDSYNIWKPSTMRQKISEECEKTYGDKDADKVLSRNGNLMYVEWWLHNVGYYATKPLCNNKKIAKINKRFKDVDLEEIDNKRD